MADVESKSIPHELPSSHWLKATGQCVLERYLSATMRIGQVGMMSLQVNCFQAEVNASVFIAGQDVVPVSGQISERARGQNIVFFLSIWKNCDSRFGTKLGNKVVKTKL